MNDKNQPSFQPTCTNLLPYTMALDNQQHDRQSKLYAGVEYPHPTLVGKLAGKLTRWPSPFEPFKSRFD